MGVQLREIISRLPILLNMGLAHLDALPGIGSNDHKRIFLFPNILLPPPGAPDSHKSLL
jgi:hypothetical protein